MKKRKLVCLMTAMILASSAALPADEAAGGVTGDPPRAALPSWVPDDFDSALEFRNTYGASHVADGMICMVFAEEREPASADSPQGLLRYEIAAEGDSAKLLQKEYYNSSAENGTLYFEVHVYQAVSAGAFAVSFSDAMQAGAVPHHGVTRYTFDVDSDLKATETDIFSWLPDCVTEYKALPSKDSEVFARDQYVMFCLDSAAGTPYEWCGTGLEETDPSVIDYIYTSECSELTAEPLDGGEIQQILVYQAKKDGRSKIRYDYVPKSSTPYRPDEVQQTRIADCMVIDSAQSVLLSGQSRVTVVDYDTGALLSYSGDSVPTILTDVRYENPDGTITTGPVYELGTNPTVLGEQFTAFFDADYFTFEMENNLLPEGYVIPGFASTIGYYNGEGSPKDAVSVSRYENGSANIVFKLKNAASIEYKTVISFYDADTGELIEFPDNRTVLGKQQQSDDFLTGLQYKQFQVESNPWTTTESNVLERNWQYFLYVNSTAGYYDCAQFENAGWDLEHTEISCKMKWHPDCDLNDDDKFTYQDIVLLENLLLGKPNAKTKLWEAADLHRDKKLDASDLALMKRYYFRKNTEIVQPQIKGDFFDLFMLVGDNLNLYAGPGTDYMVIETFPLYTEFWERGFNHDNDDWVYVETDSVKGWIKTVCDNSDEPNIWFHGLAVDKPVIYLYPEQETDVHVELELTESELSTTYPKYNNGWDVTASPDGSLLNKADGTHHKYLFWDAVNCRTRFDLSKGFCVSGSDTERFLKEKLTYMGLTEEEMNEFIVYWLPRMEHNAYNLISFQGEAYTNSAKLHISPEPDSLLRVFMAYVPLENAVETEPQQLEAFERKGFAVVEWGGTELPS